MSIQPTALWQRLPAQLQAQIYAEVITIIEEVIHDYSRTHHPHHLTRKAIIYIRQSNPYQVLTNQESLHLQYALRNRAVVLGWRREEIEVIDGDLGLSGAATHYRKGFKELLTRVTVGEVGIILSVEVQRLSRNCSDWYPLLDLCGYKHCLIADRDGVYDPGSPNGRLLLGLKG